MRKLWEEVSVYRVSSFRTGSTVVICRKHFRVLGWSNEFDQNITITRAAGLWFYAVLALWRLDESVWTTSMYLIVLLSIWKLASRNPATRPHWRDIYILARLAKVFERKTETLPKEENDG